MNNATVTALTTFAIAILIAIGIFLIIRSLVLWYWKVDTIVENQARQLKEQQKMNSLIEQLINANKN